jgi:hypothetical protein
MRYRRRFAPCPLWSAKTFLLALFVLGPSCDRGGTPDVGKPCETGAILQPGDSYLFPLAKECSTGLCLKPIDHSVTRNVDTESFCTATCTDDGDCDGQQRDPAIPADRRCQTGFACAIAFESGDKACEKLCVCRDFLPSDPLQVPAKCAP